MSRIVTAGRRIQWILFTVSFITFSYFHQGGGWNQNVRFAMVRAMVEEGNLWIDSYLIYVGMKTAQGHQLVRLPVRNGEFTLEGKNYALSWPNADGRVIPLNSIYDGQTRVAGQQLTFVQPEQVAVSGDVSFYKGHFHPAKGPGGTFVAVPAYFLIYNLERILGVDPDDWWTLTLNAWMTTALSIGLLSALGCVLFFRLGMKLSDGGALESLLTTLTFGFGTMFFLYATAFYEHNVIAVALLGSFYLMYRVKEAEDSSNDRLSDRRIRVYLSLAGLSAGCAAITNYIMAIVALLLGFYLILSIRRKGGWLWYGLGLLGPFLLICAYNTTCFATPFTTNYSYENPIFKTESKAFLDIFLWPQLEVLPMVLVSPFRGLFVTAPILLVGLFGLIMWTRDRGTRAEAWLIISIITFFLLFIVTFNGWHGGWAVSPRYLVPMIPFLALPVVFGFRRFFKTACALAALSVAISLLITAVDPQAPVGIAPSAKVDGRPQWKHSPLLEYEWPLFSEEHPWPLLNAQRDQVLKFYDHTMKAGGAPVPVRVQRLKMLAEEIDDAIRSGKPAPLLLMRGPDGQVGAALSELSTIVGPVSVNPIGVYEGWMYRVFPPHSSQAKWNSFNIGEFLFEQSRWSLVPLLIMVGLMVVTGVQVAMKMDRSRQHTGYAIQLGGNNPS